MKIGKEIFTKDVERLKGDDKFCVRRKNWLS